MITSVQKNSSPVIEACPLTITQIDDKINSTNEKAIKIFCNYSGCKQENALAKLCSRCKKAYYCNKICQTQDWVSHKILCRPPVSIISDSICDTTFNSTKLVLKHKRFRGYMMPVYSPKEDLPFELNFSTVAPLYTKLLDRLLSLTRSLMGCCPEPHIYLSNKLMVLHLQSIICQATKEENEIPLYELCENILIDFLIAEDVLIQQALEINENPENILKYIQMSAERYLFKSSRKYGNHILYPFTISEEILKPFGGDVAKINPSKLSCDKFALLMSGITEAKDLIFNSDINSLLLKIEDYLTMWGYKPVEIPKKGDLVVYYLNSAPVHLGVFMGKDRVLSKKGISNPSIIEHEIFDVCAQYGKDIVFFSKSH